MFAPEVATFDFELSLKTTIEKGDYKQLEMLITKGSGVKESDCGTVPLMLAVQRNDAMSIRLLLNAGADVNIQDSGGKTALMFAVENSGANSFVLFEAKDDLFETSDENMKCLRTLLEAGADVNIVDNNQNTALMYAAKWGNHDCVKMLLTAETDVNKLNKKGETAVICAAKENHEACMELLLKSGADVNTQDNRGCTALIYAAELLSNNCFNVLLSAGADVNIRNEDGLDALYFALKCHDDASAIMCINGGAEVNKGVLMWASTKGYSEYLNKCIDAGEDVNYVDSSRNTPLIAAAEGHALNKCNEERHQTIRCLLATGANVNYLRYDHQTALSVLVWKNCTNCVNVAIDAGADVNMRGFLGEVPLSLALKRAQSNNPISFTNEGKEVRSGLNKATSTTLSSLIKAGADVNVLDNYGNSALHLASVLNHSALVKLLLNHSVRINFRNPNNYNALRYYFKYSGGLFRSQTAVLLLVAGEDYLDISMPHVTGFTREVYPNNFLSLVTGFTGEIYSDIPLSHMAGFTGNDYLDIPTFDVMSITGDDNPDTSVSSLMGITDWRLCLKHQCREAIRRHLITVNPHGNLFVRIPLLGLPAVITRYLLFNVSIATNENDD